MNDIPYETSPKASPIKAIDLMLMKQFLGWLITLFLPLVLYFYLPPSVHDLSGQQGVTFLALIAGAVCMWVFQLTPVFVPALLVTLLSVTLNLAPREVVVIGFGSDVIFLVLGMFLFAALISSSGFAWRISLWLTTRLPNNRFTQPFILFSLGTLLSALIPSPLGRSAILTPLAVDLSKLSIDPRRQATLQVSSMQGGFLFCTVFLTGNPLNFVMLGFLNPQVQLYFQWLNWFSTTFIVGLVLLASFCIWLFWRCRNEQAISAEEMAHLKQEFTQLGKFENGEKGASMAMIALVISILTMSFHQIGLAWVTLFIALVIFLFGGLKTDDMRHRVDWPTLVFIASIVSWGPMLQHLNLDQFAVQYLQWLGVYLATNPLSGILVLSLVIFGIRLFFPGAPTVVILMGVLVSISANTALSPWVLGFCLVTLSEAFFLSYQHGVMSQVQSLLKHEQLLHSEMQRTFLRSNIWFAVARVIALCATLPYWSNLALIQGAL